MKLNSVEANGLDTSILEFCRHIAGQSQIVAVALVDNYSMKKVNKRIVYEVMVVIREFQPRLMSYIKSIDSKTVFLFAVDQWIFERDIDRGFIGEAVASKLIFPYQALFGVTYLHKHEVTLKKRLISELMENLVFVYPEMAGRMQILPQYFLYEVISNRIRIFPLLAYDVASLTQYITKNEQETLTIYKEALAELEAENKIYRKNGYIVITKEFIEHCQDPKIRILNLAKNAPRTLFSSFFGVLPQLMNIVSQNTEEFLRTQKINWTKLEPGYGLIDSQKYVFFSTKDGLISLAEKIDIKGFVKKMLHMEQSSDVSVEPLGGVLNDVYLINPIGDKSKKKVLAKRFKDWSGFKWFPLTLWSFGARSFSVSGQARLAKESAISEFLRIEGFNVPKILHISNAERLVFMEYIEGENLSYAVKRIANAKFDDSMETDLQLIAQVGKIMAQVHARNVSLGDTKPDNVLIKRDGTIYLIDFEQAAQGGDRAWDIAVFLYYCGHYLQPFDSNRKAEAIAKAFIDGYLREGGNVDDIRKAGSTKYQRVFSIFTMPAIILSISTICKRAKEMKQKMQLSQHNQQ
jgi:Kae1-associated kinase Bud32